MASLRAGMSGSNGILRDARSSPAGSHALSRLPPDVLLHCLVPLLEFKDLAALMLASKELRRVLYSGNAWRAAALTRWDLSLLSDSYWRWLESDHVDEMLQRAMQVLRSKSAADCTEAEAALSSTLLLRGAGIAESQAGDWWMHVCKHFHKLWVSLKTDVRWLLRSPPLSAEEQSRFDGVRKLLPALQLTSPTLSDLRVASCKAHVSRKHRRGEEDQVENVPDHIALDCSTFYEVSPVWLCRLAHAAARAAQMIFPAQRIGHVRSPWSSCASLMYSRYAAWDCGCYHMARLRLRVLSSTSFEGVLLLDNDYSGGVEIDYQPPKRWTARSVEEFLLVGTFEFCSCLFQGDSLACSFRPLAGREILLEYEWLSSKMTHLTEHSHPRRPGFQRWQVPVFAPRSQSASSSVLYLLVSLLLTTVLFTRNTRGPLIAFAPPCRTGTRLARSCCSSFARACCGRLAWIPSAATNNCALPFTLSQLPVAGIQRRSITWGCCVPSPVARRPCCSQS
jgi:hypothetical protein